MKKVFYLVCLFSFINILQSQNYYISGQVIDSTERKPLASANVVLVQLPDSNQTGTITERNGKFTLDNLQAGNYLLKIRYIGYSELKRRIKIINKSVDLGKIFISSKSIETDVVEVIGEMPTTTIQGDTTIYNAEAFKVNKDASTEDLITKMPGITVEDGKLKAQGEDVKKVLVDGKPFFGDDPNAVIKNIPAEMIEKVQVFDQLSDQSQFTGFDDGNASKTMNIVTRLEFKKGIFGRISGGYGDKEKYMGSGSINFFNNEQRITLLGMFNNINDQNFSMEDLMGVNAITGSRGGGGRGAFGRMMGAMPSGAGGQSFRGSSDISNFMADNKSGLTDTKSFGLNFQDKYGESVDISSSYFFNYTNNNSETNLNRYFFLESADNQNYSEASNSNSNNQNHRFNMKLEWKIDSMNSINITPRLSYQANESGSGVAGITKAGSNTLNDISNDVNSDLSALSFNNQLLYRLKFPIKGRTLSLTFNSNYRNNYGDNSQFSQNDYYEEILFSDTLDQIANIDKNGYGLTGNFVYTEPIGNTSQLSLTSSYSVSKDKSDMKTFNNDAVEEYSLLDTLLSSVYEKDYNTQSYGLGYRYNENDFSMNINTNYNISILDNYAEFPLNQTTSRTFYSILPSINLRYKISTTKNISLNYRTRNNDPSVDQLQNVLNNRDPLQLRIGNPKLSQDYNHNIFARYSSFDMATMTSFFVFLNASYTQDYIGNRTIIAEKKPIIYDSITINQGTQLIIPENMDGYMNLRGFISWGIPVSFIKSNLNINTGVTYSSTPSIINDFDNKANSTNYTIGLVIASNIGKELDFTIASMNNYNTVANSYYKNNDREYYTNSSRIRFNWTIWNGIVFKTEVEYRYNGWYDNTDDANSYYWNCSIGKKLFENEQGEIRFSAFDILNRTSNLQRNITDTYIEDTNTNVLGSYMMLSFIYNIKVF